MEFRDFSFWTIIPHSAQQFHTSPSVVYLPSTREFVPRSEYHFCYHCVIRHAHYYMRSSAPWVRHLCSSLVVLNTLAVRDEDASRMERTAAFALLGLAPAATVQDIKTAYKKLVSRASTPHILAGFRSLKPACHRCCNGILTNMRTIESAPLKCL